MYDPRIKRKMDGLAWFFVFWLAWFWCVAIYTDIVETPNEWVMWLFSLPPLIMSVLFAGGVLIIAVVLVYWMIEWLWAKLTRLFHLIRLLWYFTGK